MKLIGNIFGEVKPTKFEIALLTTEVEKGTYVKVYHDQYGWVLARIYDMRSFINQNSEEVIIASAKPIGYSQDKQILMPRMPFKPDQKVYLADQEIIMQIIGIKNKKEGNLYLGTLEGHNISVYLNLKKTIGKHIAVIAKTGAGKSYAVAVLIEELLKQKFPVVVIDPHGEYSSLRYENDDYDTMLKFNVSPHSYEKQIQEYAPNIIVNTEANKLTLKPKFSLEELIRIMPMQLNDKQKGILYDALKRLEGRDYSLQDLINVVHLDSSSAKWKIINGLENLRNSGVFDGLPIRNEELVQYGKASIINLRGCEQEIQELIVGKIARDLFNAKKLSELPDFFFLVEEAHNFCPEKGFGDALSSNILRTIASEGRKFGFYLGVVSQRPARIDKNVLSQCNTQIILKVTNPNDLRAIAQSIEGFTSGMENDIKDLAIGQALIVGECVEQPIVVNIRVRETKHIAKTLTEEIKKEKQNGSIVSKIKPIFLKNKERKKGIFEKIKNFFIEEV